MSRLIKLLIIISLLLILAFIQAAHTNGADALSQYQKIQSKEKNYRLFRYEDGAPEASNYRCFRDQFDYLWTQTAKSIYRFNGISFQDMRRELPEVERDSLLELKTLQGSESKVYLTGRHYIYKWIGHRFIKYVFPKDDRIKRSQFVNSKLLAIGTNGYGVLDGDKWLYVRIGIEDYTDYTLYGIRYLKTDNVTSTVSRFTLDRNNNLYAIHYQALYSLQRSILIPIQSSGAFAVKMYSAKGKFVFPVFSEDEGRNQFDKKGIVLQAEFKTTANWGIYLTFPGTNIVYRFNEENQLFLNQSIINGKQLSIISTSNSIEDRYSSYLTNNRIVYTRSDTLFIHDLDHGIDYYRGDYYYDPITPDTWYLIYTEKGLIEVKNQITHGFDFVYPRHVLREVSGLLYLNPVETPAIDTPLRYGNAPSYWNDGQYLAYSVAQSSVKGTHRLYLINLAAGTRKEIEVADEAESLHILDYNEVSNYLTIAGKDGIRLVSLSLPSYLDYGLKESEQYTFSEVKESILGKLVLLRRESDNSSVIFLDRGQEIKKLVECPRLGGWHYSYSMNKLFYWYSDKQGISFVEYDFQSGLSKTIEKSPSISKITCFNERYLILFGDLSYTIHSSSGSESGSMKPLVQPWKEFLDKHNINSDALISKLALTIIDEANVFIPPQEYPISTEPDGVKTLSSYHSLYSQDPLPARELTIITGSSEKFRTPAYIYNLKTMLATPKPDWMSAQILRNKKDIPWIVQLSNSGNDHVLKIGELDRKTLSLMDQGFSYKFSGTTLPKLQYYTSRNKLIVVINDRVYYNHNNSWQYMDVNPFTRFGRIDGLSCFYQTDTEIWLIINGVLIRHDLSTGQDFVFKQSNGMPEGLSGIYYSSGALRFVSSSGIYTFNPENDGAQLVVPWIEAKGERYGSGVVNRLKHSKNSIIIPVDILNTMFPERVKLTYRLLGYEKDWKQRDYTTQIEYPKLPPGHYEFQIYATSPTGLQSKPLSVFFIIKAPVYGTWWAFVIYALGLFALGRYLYRLRIKQLQRRNEALEQTVMLRTHELQKRQRHIQESIEYASLIQKSILPQDADLADAFREHFVLWKPRATVGGDFYWLHRAEDDVTWFALIDCTGHGVPGALLSMTVNSLLNHLIKDKGMVKPAEILQTMHREIGMALHQDRENTQQDGIEIALLKIHKEQLIFCGAALHLLYYEPQTRSLQQVRGDKRGLGGLKWHSELSFTEHPIPWNPQMRIYLYTDGIIDQPLPLDERLQRLGNPRWLELVNNLAELPFEEQHHILEERLQVMLSYDEQRDDITIIGLQIG